MAESQASEQYVVVINGEQQYSIWPESAPMPVGWAREGKADSREACLERIGELWTDMRPRSLRDAAAPKS